jgi:hypothetical protein
MIIPVSSSSLHSINLLLLIQIRLMEKKVLRIQKSDKRATTLCLSPNPELLPGGLFILLKFLSIFIALHLNKSFLNFQLVRLSLFVSETS